MKPEQYQKVVELFEAALDLPAAERDEFLLEACGLDPTLLQQVHRLLEADAQAQIQDPFAQGPAGEADASPSRPESSTAETTAERRAGMPDRLGDYRLQEALGRGGMGVVWKAQHQQTGVAVALKTVRVPDETLLQGLRREIRSLARLQHPGIVRILDEGIHEGLPWYAMELLEGQTLNRYWAQQTTPPAASTPPIPPEADPSSAPEKPPAPAEGLPQPDLSLCEPRQEADPSSAPEKPPAPAESLPQPDLSLCEPRQEADPSSAPGKPPAPAEGLPQPAQEHPELRQEPDPRPAKGEERAAEQAIRADSRRKRLMETLVFPEPSPAFRTASRLPGDRTRPVSPPERSAWWSETLQDRTQAAGQRPAPVPLASVTLPGLPVSLDVPLASVTLPGLPVSLDVPLASVTLPGLPVSLDVPLASVTLPGLPVSAAVQSPPVHPTQPRGSSTPAALSSPHPDLRKRASTRVPDLPLALRLVHDLCAPLAYLHGEGLVHRDLKPQNILIRPDGKPVLIDFGLLASFTGELSREALELEILGAGTATYMAPEQIRAESCDARADLYSLGCILYELVTGQKPFQGESTLETLAAHLHQPLVPPSRLAPEIPPALDDLLLRLLAKDPRKRLGHADDLAAALRRLGVPWSPSEAPPARAYLYRPGFSGRQHELQSLRQRLACLGQTPCIALVGGSSGMGKTRLALELAREATLRPIDVLTGESPPPDQHGAAAPLASLRQPLQRLADRCREHGLPETQRVFGAHAAVLAAYEPALTTLPGFQLQPPLADLPPALARRRLFRALAEVLEAVAGPDGRPLLLVLDDLQWADGLTLGFLRFLQDQPAWTQPGRLRLMLLGLYRTEEVADPLGSLLESPALHLRLGRLEPEAVATMVAEMLAQPQPPALFSRFLDRHSEGNPFFVAEYLRAAVAEALLGRDQQGHWQIAQPANHTTGEPDYEALALPRSLRQLVLRRLEGLPAPALRLAEAASVLGRHSEIPILRRMLELDGPDLDAAIQELLRRQVLEEPAAGHLSFVHDKIREVAYQQLPDPLRPPLHRAAALALEAVGQPSDQLAQLGWHWEAAGDRRRARAYDFAAARRAVERFAYDEAETLFRAHLRLAEAVSLDDIEARNELGGRVYDATGRYQEALAEHEIALAQSRDLGHRPSQGESLRLIGLSHWSLGHLQQAIPFHQQALDLHREVGDRRLEGITLGNLAHILKDLGRRAEARQMLEQALAIHRELGNRLVEGHALTNLGSWHSEQGQFAEALVLYQQALAIHHEVDDRSSVGTTLGNLATLHRNLGQVPEASEMYRKAIQMHQEMGNRRSVGYVSSNLASLELEQGHMDQSRRLNQLTLSIARELRDTRFEGHVLAALAWLELLTTGNIEQATALADQAETLLAPVRGLLLASLFCCQGHITLAAGRNARPHLQRAEALAATLEAGPESELGQEITKLRHASEAFEAGQHTRLFRGHLLDELPEGVRRWLTAQGLL